MNKKIIIFLFLCVFGLLGNYFKVPLFFGIDVIFGSIATLLVVVIFGAIPGAVAGLIIGGVTWFLWGHPYAMVIFGLEALFVGLAYKNQRSLALVDGFYWLFIGAPLVFVSYGGILNLNFDTISLIATKQALNGIMNAVIVGLVLVLVKLYGKKFININQPKASFREIIFNIIIAVSLVSAAVPAIFSNYNYHRELEREVKLELEAISHEVKARLRLAELRTPISKDNFNSWILSEFNELERDIFVGTDPFAISAKNQKGITLATWGEVKAHENGIITKNQNGVMDLWMPPSDLPLMKRWKAAHYLYTSSIDFLSGEKIILTTEIPTSGTIQKHTENSFYTLLLLTLMLGLALVFGHFLSNLLILPIRRISDDSKRISQNLTADVAPKISCARFAEYDVMVGSLRTLSVEIIDKFHALNLIRSTLEDEVEERTKEIGKLAVVAKQVSNGVVITNLDGEIEWVNEGFLRITGYDLDELVGKTPGSILQGEDSSAETIKVMNSALYNREPFHVEIINYRKDGRSYWTDISCNPMLDDADNVIGYIAVETDIEQRKQIELDLIDSRSALESQLEQTLEAQLRIEAQAEELTYLAEMEAGAHVEAESAVLAKSEFLASMSHEIRTPMTGVMGFADMLLDDELSDSSRGKVEKIIETSKSLLTIINDILDISKMDAGKLQIENINFNPIEIAEGVTQLFQQTCSPEKMVQLEITVDFAEGFPDLVSGDPSRLRQILINLMGNAVKFTDEGSVTLRGENDIQNKMLRFEISDTGIGIDQEARKNLFTDFSQADASISRKYQGTGLGLSICKRLVVLLGGRINVESDLGQGSTFSFTVPYETATDEISLLDDKPLQSENLHNPQQLRILAAEDNEINQTIIEAILTRMTHSVTFANNGLEAVQAVQSNDFDLVLMDIRMPEMSGPEATIQIRKFDGPKANIPIIALTADIMADNRQSYFDAGMNDCVGKPINHDELVVAINKAMKSNATEPDTMQEKVIKEAAFDVDEIKTRLGLPEEVLMPLLQKFANDYGEINMRFADQAKNDEHDDIVKLAHELKGVSGSLGFVEINTLITSIESSAKERDSDAIRNNLGHLSASLKEAVTQINLLSSNNER